jgi:DNA-binding SARP family transcriptional activator/ABC-type transport system substrate-binding protein
MPTRIEFSILGPLEVRVGAELLPLGGPKQRALLAILLLNANRAVSRERLMDELLGGEALRSAPHNLRVQISRLRKTLAVAEGESRLLTRPPGYLFRVEDGELDLHRFENLLADGLQALERSEPKLAAMRLQEAESLWRGDALADLELEPFLRVDVARLDELRLFATEHRIEAELTLGRHAALVPELESLVAEHPLRERLRGQLMLALYRSGRQAEALEAYRSGRTLLVNELALDPGPRLKELEQAILQQHASLELHSTETGTGAVAVAELPHTALSSHERTTNMAGRTYGRQLLRRRLLVSAVIAVLLAGTALAGAVEVGGSAARPALRPGVVALLDSRSGKLLTQAEAGPTVGTVQSGLGAIWDEEEAGILLKIDRQTLRPIWSQPVGQTEGEFGVGAGGIWMVAAGSRTLLKFDPAYGRLLARIALPRVVRPQIGPFADSADVIVADGSVWVAHGLSQVDRINPGTGRIEHVFRVTDAGLVTTGGGAIWVAASDTGVLTEIDPQTNQIVERTRIQPWICCLAAGGGFLWASNNNQIWKLSPEGQVLSTFPTPSQTGNIAYGDGSLWVANDAAGSVTRIDAQTDAIRTFRLGHYLAGIGTAGRIIAVAVRPTDSELLPRQGRILQVRMTEDWIGGSDPAVAAQPGSKEWPWLQQLLYATSARLLTYRDLPAPAGWRLVPEIAQSLPSVSADGQTYSFTIRRGFRFSPPSGQRVTAATFKYSIERALSPELGPDAPAVSVASDIVGVKAFRAGRAAHISGIREHGNTLKITLVRPAPDFPARIALSYFTAVPIGTPAVPNGLQDAPLPSAGPYYLSGYGGGFAVLRRNPNYHGSRPQRLDAIIYRGQPLATTAVTAVAKGRADYIAEPDTQLAATSALARTYARPSPPTSRRYFSAPLQATDELAFNTARGPLKNASLRIAINLVLDRPALAQLFGDSVTDRYLPPGIPGHRSWHVYPLTSPRVRAARALTRGRTADLSLAVCAEPACLQAGDLIKADLKPIGIQLVVRRYPGAIRSQLRLPGANIVLARVFPPYPDPVAALRVAVGTNPALDRIHNIAFAKRGAAAERLEFHLLRRQPPAAAFGTPTVPQFFSDRVGCKIFQPLFFGVDLANLCLLSR